MIQPPDTVIQRSPIQDWLVTHGAQFRIVSGSSFAVRLRADDTEPETMELLGICDVSGLRKFGLKGRDAEKWLLNANQPVPKKMFESVPLADGGLIVRFGSSEFFLESGLRNESVSVISRQFELDQGRSAFQRVVPVRHEEATFLLSGSRVLTLLSQTCGINFRDAVSRQAVFTRVAGVNCCVLPDTIGRLAIYRIWVDPGYALYLWETLIEIGQSLGGGVIGAACIYPEMTES